MRTNKFKEKEPQWLRNELIPNIKSHKDCIDKVEEQLDVVSGLYHAPHGRYRYFLKKLGEDHEKTQNARLECLKIQYIYENLLHAKGVLDIYHPYVASVEYAKKNYWHLVGNPPQYQYITNVDMTDGTCFSFLLPAKREGKYEFKVGR